MSESSFVEKRQSSSSASQALDLLNHSQRFQLGELGQCGGELSFVRNTDHGALAVVEMSGQLVTIDREGVVDEKPDIKVRNKN